MAIDRFGGFDFIDSHSGKTIMLQLGEIAIITTLDDSCAAIAVFETNFMKITGPLSPFQLREIVAHFNFINLSLKEKPEYRSFIKGNGEYKIQANVPEKIELLDEKDRFVSIGEFLRYYIEPIIGEIDNREKVLNEIKAGKRTYLFDETGKFIDYSK